MEKILIAAVSKNNVIGSGGEIPWNLKAELHHFKSTTSGFPVIMGRQTWESIKNPLENRINIIVTRNLKFLFSHPNVVICNSINEALQFCEKHNFTKVYFIGGEDIYQQTIHLADKMIISKIKKDFDGDKYFPIITDDWIISSKDEHDDFTVIYYTRRNNKGNS